MQWDESPTVFIDMPQPHIILTVVLSPNMGDVISTLLVNTHEDNNLVRCTNPGSLRGLARGLPPLLKCGLAPIPPFDAF